MASTQHGDGRPDRRRRPGFDPTSIDLTDFDVARVIRGTVDVGGSLAARATELARDATYVTVGLGLLGYQRAQVRRRELERSLRR
jgi:hypothetical protein